MCRENKILHPDYYFFLYTNFFFEKNKKFELFSNMFTNNIYLVLKLGGGGGVYYGTHWRAGNRLGLLPEEHLFVCLLCVRRVG
jgi:hypothetical protein